MVGSLWTGISGLSGSQTALDNESNNIANVNTIGYKSSRISFTDQMYQAKIGKGVTSFDVEKMYTQGNLKLTGVSYDMALSGDGFFVASNGAETFYTRAGNFRMGESGSLEDVGKNKVQGWAMQPIKDDNIVSTDPNATRFSEDFTKLLGNKIIRDTTSIETIIAKATDYTATAVSDSNTVFTGSGYKSASTKIADVEKLITEYNKLLTTHSNADPKPTASSSSLQKSYMDFKLDTVSLAEGDELYAYIDGTKYSQSFSTDEATTISKFIDVLSNTPGFKAHHTADSSTHAFSTPATDPAGGVYLEGLVPAESFRITEFGWTDASNSNQAIKGEVVTVADAIVGTGMGAIESIEEALAQAVSGKQQDVYTTDDLKFSATNTLNDMTYQVSIFDNELKTNVTIPSSALALADMTDVDEVVAAINNPDYGGAVGSGVNTLTNYVMAYNINGNLVVKTLDKNNDVEFTGTLTSTTQQELQTMTVTGTAGAASTTSFLGTAVAGTTGGETSTEIANAIIADKASIISAWNTAAGAGVNQIEDITVTGGTTLVIQYVQTTTDATGLTLNPDTTTSAVSNSITFGAGVETQTGGASYTVVRNINYSGREGAAAEFLKINTMVNQTASHSNIQLRLDTLSLTDSAFGEFSVDDTGLITMKQDGTDYAIGQIAVARFTDNRGLDPIGDNLYKSTNRSGQALYKINNYETAAMKGGTLELSTANLSESLVNLMVFQRAFEANAKSITTADQILTTLIQLKR